MSAAAPSAHVCTTPADNPYNRPYRPRNYGHVAAGSAPAPAPAAKATVDLRAFADVMPPQPAGPDLVYWAMCARQTIAQLQAMVLLAQQIHATLGVPKTLGAALAAGETALIERVRNLVEKHVASGGTDGAQLLVEMNAARGAA